MSNCMTCKEFEGFDPGFKLFGKTIPVSCHPRKDGGNEEKASAGGEQDTILVQSSSCEQNKDEPCVEGGEEVGSSEAENKKKDGQAALKKPDKLLPCPRCESMDTKFCYYNNYNVNQPRHFCKNCQRYWTAGGSLRNVPVGAGRRKNKQSMASSPHGRQIRSALGYGSDEYENAIACARPLKLGRPTVVSDQGATELNFGPDGKPRREQQSRDEISCGSSVTAEREAAGHRNTPRSNGAVAGCPPVPFFTGPWPYGWNVNVGAPGPWGAMPWPMVAGTPWATGPWMPAPWPVVPAVTITTNNQPSSNLWGNRADACLYAPKTLRIDDPGKAARSSIWASSGLGNTSECNATAFKAFHPKTEVQSAAASQAFRANPAAFSRSISFQESN